MCLKVAVWLELNYIVNLSLNPVRSGENQVTMHKCFLLLIFMVIILPSLGLTRYSGWKRKKTEAFMSFLIFIFESASVLTLQPGFVLHVAL